MDRVAAALVDNLRRHHAGTIEVTPIAPQFVRRATRFAARTGGWSFTADRFLNRLWDYPLHVGRLANDYDLFHVVDHSYSQLVHRLPPGRAIVTCHDLDTFRALLHPVEEPRSWFFKAMVRHVLTGMQRAARVTCDSATVRDEVISRGLVAADRVVVAAIGTAPEYSSRPDPDADREAARLVAAPAGAIELLHVGSTMPRKRIDLLLRICGELRGELTNLHLIRVGGAFTPDQRRLAQAVGMDSRTSVVEFVDDRTLAAIYRRATIVLLPSDREGFGLPLVESMACGTPVVVSDLPVFREVGGTAAEYCAPGSVSPWSQRVLELLHERRYAPERWAARREAGQARARRMTWTAFAARLAQVYREVAADADPMLVRTPA